MSPRPGRAPGRAAFAPDDRTRMIHLVWPIPALPLAGALVTLAFGRRLGHRAHWVAVPAVGLAFGVALLAFLRVWHGHETFTGPLFDWIVAGTFRAAVAFQLDPLSAVMMLVVTGVGFLIHVYSIGYMHDDPGFPRFFAYLNLFIFSMLMLVLADNLLLLFVGWEGVGLCSYLLIGFWYERESSGDAGKKAFIVNRIGDCGVPARHLPALDRRAARCDVRARSSAKAPALAVTGDRVLTAHRPAPLRRRVRQVGADPALRLAARRDGRPDAGLGADPRGDHGDGRRLHGRPARTRSSSARRVALDGGRVDRRADGALRRDDRARRRPTSRRCSPTRPSASSATCSSPSAWARSRRASSTSSRTPSSRRSSSSAPAR